MKKYDSVVIDIAGYCNASCKWCTTGIRNRNKSSMNMKTMSVDDFKKVIQYLEDKDIIPEDAVLELFSWGEPFLNKDLNEICGILTSKGYCYRLSTNGSVVQFIDSKNVENMKDLVFSVSGFSKETYGKIHILNFDKIKSNMVEMADYYNSFGKKRVVMNYHVYQQNISEIADAKAFCDANDIDFLPHIAYIADYQKMISFRNHTMPYEELYELSQEMILSHYAPISSAMPTNYRCPQKEKLVIDVNSNVLPCCFLTSEYALGSIFDLELNTIVDKKKGVSACKQCYDTAACYIISQDSRFSAFDNKNKLVYNPKIYLDYGEGFSEANVLFGNPISTNGHYQSKFIIPSGVCSIRFDPVEGGQCTVRKLQVYQSEKQIPFHPLNAEINSDILLFETLDPQIKIDIAEGGGSEIRITANIQI